MRRRFRCVVCVCVCVFRSSVFAAVFAAHVRPDFPRTAHWDGIGLSFAGGGGGGGKKGEKKLFSFSPPRKQKLCFFKFFKIF